MSAREWPRSLRPDQRDPTVWNPWVDGLARLYRHVRPGERPAGMAMTLIDGNQTSVLLLEKDGEVRRLTLRDEAGAELECEWGRRAKRRCPEASFSY